MDNLKDGQSHSLDEIDSTTSTLDYMKNEIGMCRILINDKIPTITWAKFKHVSGISEKTYNSLEMVSRNKGSLVDKWLCTFNAIPKKHWEGDEMFVDNQWVRWDEKMPIQEFVDLCLSCNGKKVEKDDNILINGFPKVDAQSQLDFFDAHIDEIRETWEANKNKKGYIEIYITSDYKPYPTGFEFIEKRIRKSSFNFMWVSETEEYALVHFLWEATRTQYKLAVAI